METSRRTSKVITLEQAASWIKDGMTVAFGGVISNNAPNAFCRELIRRGINDLTVFGSNNAGYQIDILLGAGCVKKLYSSYVGLDYIGFAPNFRRLGEAGKLNHVDLCELGLLRALKAGQCGFDFFPLPSGIKACDNVKLNPDWYKEVESPFTGKKVVVVPPLRSDIAIIHVAKCDAYGSARELGQQNADLLYHSADKVIVTTEEIVPLEDTWAHYREVTISPELVNAVVEVPWGSHPGECHGCYPLDEKHMREYAKAGREEATFKEYLDKYVYGCKNHAEYLEKVGVEKLLELRYKYY